MWGELIERYVNVIFIFFFDLIINKKILKSRYNFSVISIDLLTYIYAYFICTIICYYYEEFYTIFEFKKHFDTERYIFNRSFKIHVIRYKFQNINSISMQQAFVSLLRSFYFNFVFNQVLTTILFVEFPLTLLQWNSVKFVLGIKTVVCFLLSARSISIFHSAKRTTIKSILSLLFLRP